MDFGGLLLIAFLFLFFRALTRSGQHGRRQPPARETGAPAPPAGRGDATQQEGSRLEQMLRELQRSMDEAAAESLAAELPSSVRRELPGAEEVEDRTSLEEEPTIISLETEVERPAREMIVYDDRAQVLVQRRIDEARQRDGALTAADHRAFDARIRQEPADHTAVVIPGRIRRLREAVVWSEILGPPKALRG